MASCLLVYHLIIERNNLVMDFWWFLLLCRQMTFEHSFRNLLSFNVCVCACVQSSIHLCVIFHFQLINWSELSKIIWKFNWFQIFNIVTINCTYTNAPEAETKSRAYAKCENIAYRSIFRYTAVNSVWIQVWATKYIENRIKLLTF